MPTKRRVKRRRKQRRVSKTNKIMVMLVPPCSGLVELTASTLKRPMLGREAGGDGCGAGAGGELGGGGVFFVV